MTALIVGQSVWFGLLLDISIATGVMAIAFGVGLVRNRIRDVDIFWPAGLALISLANFVASSHRSNLAPLLALGVVILWAVRLGGYLFWRGRGSPEDPRYEALVGQRNGLSRALRLLIVVYGLQALAMSIVALPPVTVMWTANSEVPLALVGAVIALSGTATEAIADRQLARFQKSSQRGVLDTGLWGQCRHPNYLGEIVVWWGLFLLSLSSWKNAPSIASPLLMTWLLLKVSGRDLLERHLLKAKPAYRDYAERVPGIMPRLRKP